ARDPDAQGGVARGAAMSTEGAGMRFDGRGEPDFDGREVTVMGLGLFGGGTTVARFLVRHGALVSATDLRSEAELAPALPELDGLGVRFVLGRHEEADFTGTSLVVANP